MTIQTLEIDLFKLGMWYRIVYGAFRVSVGLVLLKFIQQPFPDFLRHVFHHELVENPDGLLATHVMMFFVHHDFIITSFFAFYIIFWGALDIFLSACLLRHLLWAFPFSLLLISTFMFYEIIRFTNTHSMTLIALLIVDTVVFWLIWNEWGRIETLHEKHLPVT